MTSQYQGFEQGPIRPPSEAQSLLIRVNRNCPWNRCTFCSIYKKQKFSTRPEQDVIADVDSIRRVINSVQGAGARTVMETLSPMDEQAFYAARNWLSAGMESIFLQDADALAVRPQSLINILQHIRKTFPSVKRITCYARSDSTVRFGETLLKEVADAGLNRIHIGMETASDTILGLVRKGITKEIHIRGGIMVKEAGIQLSEYFLAGLGGSALSQEHAIESADALSQINPDFIRFRNLHLPDKIRLFPDSDSQSYRWASDLVLAKEIYTLIDNLHGITSRVVSDHSYNLLQEVDGVLPDDRERLLGVVRKFIDMEPQRRMLFQVGKRSGHFHRLADMEIPGRVSQVEAICRKSAITPDNVDESLHELVQERMRNGLPF
jgi:radical SAM superfamily enzyme YgiQ (UPF0313 family)